MWKINVLILHFLLNGLNCLSSVIVWVRVALIRKTVVGDLCFKFLLFFLFSHSASLFGDSLVIFGGWDAPNCFNDIYIVNMGK